VKGRAWFSRAGLSLAALSAVVGATLLSAPAASAHGASTDGPRTWYVHVGLESRNHAIQGMVFSPSELWINAGDTVVWQADSAEIHTVTFTTDGAPPPQPFTESPQQVLPSGGSTYVAGQFFNSGVLSTMAGDNGQPPFLDYSLRFTQNSDITYYCWVHPMMAAHLHVRDAGTPYPHTQRWYDTQAAIERGAILARGAQLRAQAESMATSHQVVAGIGDDTVDVMRFIRSTVTIKVGESVTFTNWSFAPHTVTFGPEVVPPPVPIGDPSHYDGSYPLSSGFFMYGQSYTVTFTKAGDYSYICALHDMMGMVGTVHVVE
jgi:plastocyanin